MPARPTIESLERIGFPRNGGATKGGSVALPLDGILLISHSSIHELFGNIGSV
jgi:hypothetical protein